MNKPNVTILGVSYPGHPRLCKRQSQIFHNLAQYLISSLLDQKILKVFTNLDDSVILSRLRYALTKQKAALYLMRFFLNTFIYFHVSMLINVCLGVTVALKLPTQRFSWIGPYLSGKFKFNYKLDFSWGVHLL